MKKKIFEGRRNILKKAGCLALAAVIAGTGLVTYQNSLKSDVPELVTFVDPGLAETQEDEVPLAAGTKTTRKVTKKTTTKKTKMAKKAKKSKTTTKKTTKQTNKTKSSKNQTVKTNTKIDTTVKTTLKKNSNVKTTKTQVVTTVTTTTQTLNKSYYSEAAATTQSTSKAGTYNVKSVAPMCDARVLNAFEKMGCKVVVDPKVSYSGCFDAAKRTITLRQLNNTVYHELGHYLEFIGGTSAVKQLIANAYNTEKSLYTASNKAYVLQNSAEYFAESFKNYCENPGALKQSRPKTYEAIVQALNNVTDARVNTLINVYSAIWK